MNSPARKVAYSAAAAAIATLSAIAAVYLPLSIAPLVLSSFCFYIAFIKCGPVYGGVAVAATLLIAFFAGGGLNVTFVMLAVIFVPYSIAAFFMKKLSYRKPVQALLRVLITAAVINLTFMCVYFIVVYVAMGGIDVIGAMNKVGGYAVLALIATAIAVITDFLFTQLASLLMKYLK